MSQTAVNLSQLAIEQLTDMSPTAGRAMSQSLQRLTIFPESAPQLTLQNYEAYRQLLVRDYRAIYRHLLRLMKFVCIALFTFAVAYPALNCYSFKTSSISIRYVYFKTNCCVTNSLSLTLQISTL